MQDKEKGQFDGFIFNNIIYFIAMFIGSLSLCGKDGVVLYDKDTPSFGAESRR